MFCVIKRRIKEKNIKNVMEKNYDEKFEIPIIIWY